MLSFWLSAALAAEVLIPSATPLTPDDFTIAESFYRQVVAASLQAGLAVEDADGIRVWAGADAESCFDNEACPGSLWDRTDARVALVMRVGKGSSGTLVEVRLFAPDDPTPLKVMRETVQTGKEASFSAKLALTTQEILSITPQRTVPKPPENDPPEVTPEIPRIVIQPLDNPPADPDPQNPPVDAPLIVPTPPPITNRHHLPKVVFNALTSSGMSEDQWLREQRVRSRRFALQVGLGFGTGDVDRGYNVNLLIKKEGKAVDILGQESWLGSGFGYGFSGWVAVSYTPIWFLDTSLAGGMIYGSKYLSTSSTCTSGCEAENQEYTYDPGPQVQAVLEPKLRFLPLATGYVKPYVLVGATVRIYDGFDAPVYLGVDYPNVEGGAAVSPTVGGGMYIDALPDVSFFLELPYSINFPIGGQFISSYDAGIDQKLPEASALPTWGGILRVSLGVEVRL